MKCPTDGSTLTMSERSGIEIDYCPECRGVWLDRGELDKILDRAAAETPTAAPSAPFPTAPPVAPPPRREEPRYDDRRDDRRHDDRGYDDRRYDQRGYPRRKKKEHWLSELFD